MFSGPEIATILANLGVTDVVWLPDSALGPWEGALASSPQLRLIRVCREGEAWPLAAGLCLGGRNPILIMQSTGLFESGDALRNILFDLRIPLFAIVGARSYLVEGTNDSAKRFVDPILNAWQLETVRILTPDDKPLLAQHYSACRSAGKPGIALLGEGRM